MPFLLPGQASGVHDGRGPVSPLQTHTRRQGGDRKVGVGGKTAWTTMTCVYAKVSGKDSSPKKGHCKASCHTQVFLQVHRVLSPRARFVCLQNRATPSHQKKTTSLCTPLNIAWDPANVRQRSKTVTGREHDNRQRTPGASAAAWTAEWKSQTSSSLCQVCSPSAVITSTSGFLHAPPHGLREGLKWVVQSSPRGKGCGGRGRREHLAGVNHPGL